MSARKVKFTTSVASEILAFDEGKEYSLPSPDADKWVSAGFAEFVDEPQLECAAVGAPENAISNRPNFRGKR